MSKSAKRIFALILVIAVAATAGLFAKMNYNSTHNTQDTIVVRLAHVVAEDNPIHQASLIFQEELERISNGRFEVRIYPNSALGGDRQQVESTILGYIQGCVPPSGTLSAFDQRLMVIDLPFVFKSGEAATATLNGELGEVLDPILEELGIYPMGWTESGFRHITTNDNPVTSPDDLKGLSVRTMENPIHVASFRAWGANPTPMAFSELFTALQQGTVDAQENPIMVTMSNRLFEVQNTLSLTGHFFSAGCISFNKEFVDSLTEEEKAWFDEAGQHFVDNLTRLVREQEQDYIQQARDEGMNVVELTSEQKDAFIEAAADVYDLFIEQYNGSQELIDLAMLYNDELG